MQQRGVSLKKAPEAAGVIANRVGRSVTLPLEEQEYLMWWHVET